MQNELARIEKTAKEQIRNAATIYDLEGVRHEYLGRKGALSLLLRGIKDLPPHEKKKAGSEANRLREEIEELLEKKQHDIEKRETESALKKEWLDVTHPGVRRERGHAHPITLVTNKINDIFSSMGFEVVEGPEIESEYNNFDALNIPKNHPSREMHDTFWIKGRTKSSDPRKNLLLRTHISALQVPFMRKRNPPFRFIAPGRVYRYEASDASHDIQFNYVEGMMVDKNVSIANFKAVIHDFFSRFFARNIKTRLRPSYFPFTEPSFEVDISCIVCSQKGCPVCKKTGWLELVGAGMVHPAVFKNAGYIPKDIQGFAFGIGLDRLTMMKYKIPDIRLLRSGEVKFLKQF